MNKPRVSVLIPCRNEERTIGEVLEAFHSQTYPPDRMEVIIADGRSTDSTRENILSYGKSQGGWNVRVVDNPGLTAPAGLNAALREAGGEIILRMDAHAIPEPDYVDQCVRVMEQTGCEGVGGGIKILPGGKGAVARAIAAAVASPFATGGVRYRVGGEPGEVDTVPFAAFRRKTFDRIGLFNEQVPVNEDYEFNYRVRAAGGRIYFSPAIQSRYIARGDIRALARQYFLYGHQKAAMLSFHPRSLRIRQVIPALLLPSLAALAVGALIYRPLAVLLALEILAYGASAAVFAMRESVLRRDVALFPALLLVFACIHAAWGAGFWIGTVRHSGRMIRNLIRGDGKPEESRAEGRVGGRVR
jgi:succinoglycan biosynthesis protein ExoA